ncbi:MAG: bifunctional oligoribonuclease/PAP phosphatase NrnA [Patulibacter sp.]
MTREGRADADRAAVLQLLRDADRFVTVTHEHPDGDAIGSLIAATRALRALGKDVVALVAPSDLPLSREYAGLVTVELGSAVPADLEDRIALVLDCGNLDRMVVPGLLDGPVRPRRTVNVDHHHDNTRFADINFVDATASSTVEILWELFQDLGVPLDRETAEALYVGLVTDTGRFMYQNTRQRSHEMAVDLLAAGAQPFPLYRTLFEEVPWSKLALLSRALDHVRIDADAQITFAWLSRRDFAETGADNSESEGIIDHLRTVEGTRVAVLAREISADDPDDPVRTKVSLRSVRDDVDVSAIARAGGGGGHPQAAGFNTTMGEDELLAFLRAELRAATPA